MGSPCCRVFFVLVLCLFMEALGRDHIELREIREHDDSGIDDESFGRTRREKKHLNFGRRSRYDGNSGDEERNDGDYYGALHSRSNNKLVSTSRYIGGDTHFTGSCELPTSHGPIIVFGYRYDDNDGVWFDAMAVVRVKDFERRWKEGKHFSNMLVRVHDQCVTSEVFDSQRCDCSQQLDMAMRRIRESENGGAVIYLLQEGRGIGLANKIRAYEVQEDLGLDTVDANRQLGFEDDRRSYEPVAYILLHLRFERIRLMTNNPRKISYLKELGVEIVERVPLIACANPHSAKYLEAKRTRMGHLLWDDDEDEDRESVGRRKLRRLTSRRPSRVDIVENDIAPLCTAATQVVFAHHAAHEFESRRISGRPKDKNRHHTSRPSRRKKKNKDGKQHFKEPITDISKLAEVSRWQLGRRSVVEAVEAIKKGEVVIVVDDASRENEGDFIAAAETMTPRTMAYIVRYSAGTLCVPMEGPRLEELKLPPMVVNNEDPKATAFTVSVDVVNPRSTGISSAARAATAVKLADPNATAADFQRPGHMFPLKAYSKGVLRRQGHTEAAVDLMGLAGLQRVAVIGEVVSEWDPTDMARMDELMDMAERDNLRVTTIEDIICFRLEKEHSIKCQREDEEEEEEEEEARRQEGQGEEG